jgi:hypothetical protein
LSGIGSISEAVKDSANKLIALLNANLEYYKVVAYEKLILLLSEIVGKGILVITALMFLFFLSLGLAHLIGEFLGRPSLGYFIAAVFNLAGGLIVYKNRYPWIINPMIRDVSKAFEPKDEDDEAR